jgi:glycosyltransferase involved in cell wall biosynthesis
MTSILSSQQAGISVLICTYNGAKRVTATLQHLAKQQLPSFIPWEVLLVDNNSSDDTLAIGAACWQNCGAPVPLRLLRQPIAGKSHALELGFLQAQYRYICIVDDDNWLAPNYLNLAWEIMEAHPDVAAVGGVGRPVCEVEPPAWFDDFAIDYAAGRQAQASGDITSVPGFLYGAGSFIRRAAWERIHQAGFKSLLTGRNGSKLSSGEDNEMCYAFALAGYRIWYDERLTFEHFIPASRLNWNYVRRLYQGNATSEVELRPYRHFFSLPNTIPSLIWLRNGAYSTRYALRWTWQTVRKGRLRIKEGDGVALRAAYYWKVASLYMNNEWQKSPKFQQVQEFIARLQQTSAQQ